MCGRSRQDKLIKVQTWSHDQIMSLKLNSTPSPTGKRKKESQEIEWKSSSSSPSNHEKNERKRVNTPREILSRLWKLHSSSSKGEERELLLNQSSMILFPTKYLDCQAMMFNSSSKLEPLLPVIFYFRGENSHS